METVWNEIKSSLKQRIAEHSFQMWIEPLKPLRCEGECLVLSCVNRFSKKRVLDHYGSLIEGELKQKFGGSYKLQIEITEEDAGGGDTLVPQQLELPDFDLKPHNGHFLRRDFTFDQFVVGGNNDFAYTAALSLATRRNNLQNALFLLSKTGMGKSHLSQAIGHHILAQSPEERVFYVTAEDFTNEMVNSFRNDSLDSFKGKYRKNCDVLLLEDIHFLSGKERTQVELALTLDTLCNAGKKIIFTSCFAPCEIPKLHDNLRSRLSSGLISNIDPPDYKMRVKILQQKAKVNGYQVPEEVIRYLASELTENVRQLESGLHGTTAKASLLGHPITVKLAESVAKNIVSTQKSITIEAIKRLVSSHFKISVNDLVSRSRKQSIVRPRQLAIYLSRRYTEQSLQAIGKSFNRYHATAMHAINAVERGIKEKGPIRKQVEFFCEKLEGGNF